MARISSAISATEPLIYQAWTDKCSARRKLPVGLEEEQVRRINPLYPHEVCSSPK